MNVYEIITNAVIAKLKEQFADTDIYLDEAQVTEGDSFFFVDTVPLSVIVLGEFDRAYSVLVDISAFIKKATKKQYLQMADTLNSIFCPVLCFEDRAITLQDVQVQPTDDVLHYKFTLKFEAQQGEAPELENMSELLLNEEV